jgi:AraC-like DNA-binding protein
MADLEVVKKTMRPPDELQFTTASVPERKRLTFWREVVTGPMGLSFEWLGEAPFDARLSLRRFAGWWFGECANAPARLARPRGKFGAAPGCYQVLRHFRGKVLYRQAGREIIAGPRDLVVFDAALPFDITDITSGAHRVRFLAVPRAGLEPLLSDPALAVNARIPGRSGMAALLNAYLDALWDASGQVDGETGPALSEHLCQLIALALGNGASKADRPWKSMDAARFQAALAIIGRGFANPDLSAGQVAAQLGISRRSLYRLFEEAGLTFARCVRQRRLAAARRLLADRRMTVTQAAFACGFDDLSTFHRAFRAHYGMAPRELRQILVG